MNESHAFQLFQNYVEIVRRFGPFDYKDNSELEVNDESIVWSQAEVDDGVHLINGLHAGPAVDYHLVASRPCDESPFSIDVYEVYVFDCEECDETESCQICEGELMLEIDFAKLLERVGTNSADEATVWGARRPLGFEYD